MANERYILTIEPDGDGAPAIIRLRHLLKVAIRQCQLRCIDVKETNANQTQDIQTDATGSRDHKPSADRAHRLDKSMAHPSPLVHHQQSTVRLP